MRTTTLPGAQFWANWRTFLIFPQFQVYGARAVNASDGGYPANYYAEGFASVQNAISRAVLEMHSGREDAVPHVDLQVGTSTWLQSFSITHTHTLLSPTALSLSTLL